MTISDMIQSLAVSVHKAATEKSQDANSFGISPTEMSSLDQ